MFGGGKLWWRWITGYSPNFTLQILTISHVVYVDCNSKWWSWSSFNVFRSYILWFAGFKLPVIFEIAFFGIIRWLLVHWLKVNSFPLREFSQMDIHLWYPRIIGPTSLIHAHISNIMWPGLQRLTMWAQITPSYIFGNIFRSECTIPFSLVAEESPINSAVVMKICCNSINSY